MMTKEIEDNALLKRIQNDDDKAFDQLFIKYFPGLIRYGKMQLPYPTDEAEDIVLEVFSKIWQQRKKLVIHTSLKSFLYTTVKNRIYDYYRKKNIVVHEPIDDVADKAAPLYMVPDEQLVYKEASAGFEQLISLLPERTQLVFRMNREDNHTYEAIALLLNISINSVKTHIYRAVKFLKDAYRSSGTSA